MRNIGGMDEGFVFTTGFLNRVMEMLFVLFVLFVLCFLIIVPDLSNLWKFRERCNRSLGDVVCFPVDADEADGHV